MKKSTNTSTQKFTRLYAFCSLLTVSLGLGTALGAQASQAAKTKKSTKAEDPTRKNGTATDIPVLVSQSTPRSAHTGSQSEQVAKPGQSLSITSSSNVSDNIKPVNSADLLKSGHSAAPRGGQTAVEQTAPGLAGKSKLQAPLLGLGLFRSEQLAGGQVTPPGIADFASYLRNSQNALTDVKSKPGTQGKSIGQDDVTTGQLGTSTAETMAVQAEAEKLRSQTAESIKQILMTKPNPDQRIDLMMRLAELQVERHAYYLELEIKEFNEAHGKWKLNPKSPEPVFRTERSNAQLLLGIDTLRGAVTQFPNHARAPESLFTLGFLLTQMQSENAVLYFERLVSRFPKSEFVPDSYLALGEHFFSKNQFDKALGFYQKVLAYKGKPAYNYAVYKLGWTYFNLRPSLGGDVQKNLSKSLAAFRLVVKLSEDPRADKRLKSLRKEALKDLVLVFAEIGDINSAQKYYESLGEPELYFTLLERLAWQNSEAGNFANSVAIYQRLITEGPTQARLPVFYARIAELQEKQNQRPSLIKTLGVMSQALAKDGVWNKENAASTEAVDLRNKTLSKELRSWAERFHIEAQKNKRETSFDDALAAYTLYLGNFGELPESYSAHFYRAEILVHKGKLIEAAESYMKSASLDEKHSIKGRFTRDALLNAITSLDLTLAKGVAPKLPEAGHATQKIPLTALHAKVVEAIDTFTRMFPTQPETLQLSHRAANILYAFGDYGESNVRWTSLAKRHPASKEVLDGARLVVKVHVDGKAWKEAIAECRKFLEIPGVKSAKLGEELTTVLKGSLFQRALALEKQESRSEAADLFLAYHQEFQNDTDAPKALFNAANNKFKIGKMDEAISTLRILIAQYPRSELSPNVLYLIASSYDGLGQFAESAASYEQLVVDSPKHAAAPEALMRATAQRIATGEFELAIKDAQRFVSLFPTHKDMPDAWLLAGKAYTKLNNHEKAAKTYAQGAESVARTTAASGVLLYGLAAESAHKHGNIQEASRHVGVGLSLAQASAGKLKGNQAADAAEGVRLLGLTQVAMLDVQLSVVFQKSITDGMKLTEQFSKIRDEIQVLAQKYVTVAKFGNAEAGIGALYRVAEMQEFLANILLRAPVPKEAKPQEVEQFKSTLERVALPLQEEATNLYMTAWQKATETEAITPFTRKLHDKLVVLRPTEFRRSIEEMTNPAYFETSVVLTQETRNLVKN